MKVEVETLSPIKKKLKIELPYEKYSKEIDQAYKDLGKKVSIKGFRKGKVPLKILKKEYAGHVERDVISKLLETSYTQAIQEKNIFAVSYPKFEDLKIEENKPFTFSAEVEVQPDVQTTGYKDLELSKKEIAVEAQEVQEELERLQKTMTQFIPAPEGETLEKGHVASLQFSGTIDGVDHKELSAKNAVMEVGAGQYLPDFERGILGMKKGDSKKVEVEFPKDYPNAKFASKKAVFEILVEEVKKKELPALDDEFAKDLGQYQNLDEVKKDIEKKILEGKGKQQESDMANQAIDQLIERNTFELPQVMVERELEHMYQSTLKELKTQRLTPEQVGLTPENYRERNLKVAEKRIRGFLILDSIAKQENILVEEKDVNARFVDLAKRFGQPVEAVKKYHMEQKLIGSLINQIVSEKVFEYILSQAKMKTVEK